MNDADRFKLLHGPYAPPRCKIGGRLVCRIRGEVVVRTMSSGLIPWPRTKVRGGWAFIICDSLARAVRMEAAVAVCHWWGVGPRTVSVWRKALGVSEANSGTRQLRSRWLSELIPDDRRKEGLEKARAKAATPEGKAKHLATNSGRPVSPKQAAALARGREMARAPEVQKKAGQTRKRLGIRPPSGRLWTAEEDALLGKMSEAEVMERTGRSLASVRGRRHALGLVRRRRPSTPPGANR